MPNRTIEQRLEEVRSSLEIREDSEQPTYIDRSNTHTANLVKKLLADFKAEGIAHRTIQDSAMGSATGSASNA